jgi:uncharacterized protein
VRLGVQGQGKAVMKAAGDINAKFITMASVEAGGDVVVQESIMHADVVAGGSVFAEGAKGSLIGGSIRAQNTIVARYIGSKAHPKTNVFLEKLTPETGEPVRESLKKQMSKVKRELDKCLADAKRLKKRLTDMNPPPNTLQQLKAATQKATGLNEMMGRISEDIMRFNAQYGPAGKRFIRAKSIMYPRVFLNIETNQLRIIEEQNTATFCCDKTGEIITV